MANRYLRITESIIEDGAEAIRLGAPALHRSIDAEPVDATRSRRIVEALAVEGARSFRWAHEGGPCPVCSPDGDE